MDKNVDKIIHTNQSHLLSSEKSQILFDQLLWTSSWYSEMYAELRWRREVEYWILTANLTFYGMLFIGLGLSNGNFTTSHSIKLAVSMLISSMAILSTLKIYNEHVKYSEICASVKRYLEALGFPDKILPISMSRFGKGRGYIITIFMLLLSGGSCILLFWLRG